MHAQQAVEQAAAIELGLAESLAPRNAPPKKTIVLDNYKKVSCLVAFSCFSLPKSDRCSLALGIQLPDGSTEPLSHTMLKTQKKNQMWQRIMVRFAHINTFQFSWCLLLRRRGDRWTYLSHELFVCRPAILDCFLSSARRHRGLWMISQKNCIP